MSGIRFLVYKRALMAGGTVFLLLGGAIAAEPASAVAAPVAAASAADTPAEGQAQSSAPAEPEEELAFFDSSSFDKSLTDELAKNPPHALVVPSGPFSPNQIPPRLERWISAVSKTGGSVKLQRERTGAPTRGFLSDTVELAVKAHKDSELDAMYAHVKNYDAILSFNGNDVTAVRFIKRAAAAPPAKQ